MRLELQLRFPMVTRLVRSLSRGRSRLLARVTLAREAVLAHRILTDLVRSGNVQGSDNDIVIVNTFVTRSDVLVAFVGDSMSDELTAVLKLPITLHAEQSLARHRQAITHIHQLPGLDGFRALVPKAMRWGSFEGRAYHLESVLEGQAASGMLRSPGISERLRRSAADALLSLQMCTLDRCTVDEALFDRVAGDDLRFLELLVAAWPGASLLRQQLGEVERRLREELLGRVMPLTWVHGDFWPGNLLCRGGSVDAAVTGIVDWDRASPGEIPLHDLFHLLVYSRKLQRGGALGEHIVACLLRSDFDPEEGALIAEASERLAIQLQPTLLRAITLVYWLRVVATHLRRYPAYEMDGSWLKRNVFLVLGENAK